MISYYLNQINLTFAPNIVKIGQSGVGIIYDIMGQKNNNLCFLLHAKDIRVLAVFLSINNPSLEESVRSSIGPHKLLTLF